MYMCHPNSKYRRCYELIRLRIHACICDRSKARFKTHNYKSKATCFDGKDQTTRSRELLFFQYTKDLYKKTLHSRSSTATQWHTNSADIITFMFCTVHIILYTATN